MKKFIQKASIFFLVIALINIIYLLVIKDLDYNFKKRVEALKLESPSYDLLVLGNSLSMDGVDTEFLSKNGFSSYNLSIAGSSLSSNYVQLKEYLSVCKNKPRWIVLGLGSYMNSLDAGNIHPIVDFTRSDKEFTLNDIPVLRFKWIFKELLKRIVSAEHRNAYLQNGQLRFAKKVKDGTQIDENQKFQIDKYESSELIKSILDLCAHNKITLIIAEMPGFKNRRHLDSQGPFVLDKSNCNGILFDYNHIEFGKIFNDKNDWIGNSHLNSFGAQKFTTHLLNDLKKIKHQGTTFCTGNGR